MDIYNPCDALWKICNNKINNRELVIWRIEKINTENIRKRYDSYMPVKMIIDNILKDDSSDTCSADGIANRKNRYYIILDGNYNVEIDKWLESKGYTEINDYIWKFPKPTKLSGNIKKYEDTHGNRISNIPDGLNIVLRGYDNIIEIGSNVVCSNTTITIGHQSRIKISLGCRFAINCRIDVGDNSIMNIGTSTYGEENLISIGSNASLYVGNRSNFGSYNEIIANDFCKIHIGDDILTSRKVVIRAGDGHSLFDVMTGNKRNFRYDMDNIETTIVGSHVWFGFDSMVLSPSVIGSGCTVGAKALAIGNYPNNCVLGGGIARVLHHNSAWGRSNIATDMDQACPPPYAIPTLFKSKMDEKWHSLSTITNFNDYMEAVSILDDKIILISVKDTPGYEFKEKEQEAINKLGLEVNLSDKHWCAYVAIIEDDEIIYESVSEIDGYIEENLKIANMNIDMVSRPLHSGNRAIIRLDGFDYSTNYRGINIVVVDKHSSQVADSVCFDTHILGCPCIRNLLTC